MTQKKNWLPKENVFLNIYKNMNADIFLVMRKTIIHINLQNTPSTKLIICIYQQSVNCYLKELSKEKEITWNPKLSLFLMKGESSQ